MSKALKEDNEVVEIQGNKVLVFDAIMINNENTRLLHRSYSHGAPNRKFLTKRIPLVDGSPYSFGYQQISQLIEEIKEEYNAVPVMCDYSLHFYGDSSDFGYELQDRSMIEFSAEIVDKESPLYVDVLNNNFNYLLSKMEDIERERYINANDRSLQVKFGFIDSNNNTRIAIESVDMQQAVKLHYKDHNAIVWQE